MPTQKFAIRFVASLCISLSLLGFQAPEQALNSVQQVAGVEPTPLLTVQAKRSGGSRSYSRPSRSYSRPSSPKPSRPTSRPTPKPSVKPTRSGTGSSTKRTPSKITPTKSTPKVTPKPSTSKQSAPKIAPTQSGTNQQLKQTPTKSTPKIAPKPSTSKQSAPKIAPTQSGTNRQLKQTPTKTQSPNPGGATGTTKTNPSTKTKPSGVSPSIKPTSGTGLQLKSTPKKVRKQDVSPRTTIVKSNPTRTVSRQTRANPRPIVINNTRYRTYEVTEPMYFDRYGYEVPVGTTLYSRPSRSFARPFYAWGSPVYYVNTSNNVRPVTSTGSWLGWVINLLVIGVIIALVIWLITFLAT